MKDVWAILHLHMALIGVYDEGNDRFELIESKRMIKYKSAEEIELMRESAQLVSKTLGMLAPLLVPGAIQLELDKKAEEFIRYHGGIPGF